MASIRSARSCSPRSRNFRDWDDVIILPDDLTLLDDVPQRRTPLRAIVEESSIVIHNRWQESYCQCHSNGKHVTQNSVIALPPSFLEFLTGKRFPPPTHLVCILDNFQLTAGAGLSKLSFSSTTRQSPFSSANL